MCLHKPILSQRFHEWKNDNLLACVDGPLYLAFYVSDSNEYQTFTFIL